MAPLLLFLLLLFVWPCLAQRQLGFRPSDSGGVLTADQAKYDVVSCELRLSIKPELQFIEGSATLTLLILQPAETILLDLDDPLTVGDVELLEQDRAERLSVERLPGKLRISLPGTRQPLEQIRLRIPYAGHPRVAPRPPWVGGFIWSRTADNQPWIGITSQMDGPDLWWPSKDHISDEIASMDLHVTVPQPLVVAVNGTLSGVFEENDTLTYHWHIANPINAYAVTLNIAPYKTLEATFQSAGGESVPITFWVLPEHYEDGKRLFPQFLQHLHFLEGLLGPYPFRNEKYGVAESPYLGMEHQTLVGYGNNYQNNRYGFDWLHLHELAHEWWGNMVTAADWSDHWLHEGFASYMEALYIESLHGERALTEYMSSIRQKVRNLMPVAPRQSQTAVQKYFVPPHYTETDGDVNYKGAWILHTLRYLVGDEAFYRILRRFAYPDPALETVTDGSQCRFVSTQDFLTLTEEVSGLELDWFFELYLRQPALPRLQTRRSACCLELEWETPGDVAFPMTVEVEESGALRRITLPESLPLNRNPKIDPYHWILKETVE